jgi:hypothetical protein
MTSSVGFIEYEIKLAVDSFIAQSLKVSGETYKVKHVKGRLLESLETLRPLNTPYDKVLFVETDSPWTAIFFNQTSGQGCPEHLGNLARYVECRGIHARYAPHTMKKSKVGDWTEDYGATMLNVYGPENVQPEGDHLKRSIYVANDGYRWEFGQWGEPLSFENLEYYQRRKRKDRFTPEILDEYLRHCGIRFFDPTFYMPAGKDEAVLLEKGEVIKEIAEMREKEMFDFARDLAKKAGKTLKIYGPSSQKRDRGEE